MERASTTVCNAYFFLAHVAHIYNALRQSKLLKESWPPLDKAIKGNMSLLFRGSLPGPEQVVNRFGLCIGVSAHKVRSADWDPKWRDTTGRSSISAYLEDYLEGKESAPRFLYNVHRQLNASKNHELSTLDLLRQLAHAMEETQDHRRLDLVGLSRKCFSLLKKLHCGLTKGVEPRSSAQGVGAELDDARLYVVLVMGILCDVDLLEKAKERNARRQRRKTSQTSAQMLPKPESPATIAAKIFRDFLQQSAV